MKNRLKEMYENGKQGVEPAISADGLLKAVAKCWITLDDAVEIIGGDSSIEVIRAVKLKEISASCNASIVAGIDLEIDGETVHFNLDELDQINISDLFKIVELGGTEFPYQSDGGVCHIYTSDQIAQIFIAAKTHKTAQLTYHNALKAYVQSMGTAEELSAVQYGMELPEPYLTEMNEKLAIAQEQMSAILERLSQV